jgi:hypothetical protein
VKEPAQLPKKKATFWFDISFSKSSVFFRFLGKNVLKNEAKTVKMHRFYSKNCTSVGSVAKVMQNH